MEAFSLSVILVWQTFHGIGCAVNYENRGLFFALGSVQRKSLYGLLAYL